jgi:hydrolase
LTKVLEERQLNISHVLLTHWHGDHTGGVPDLIAYDPKLSSRIHKNEPDRGQQPIEDGQILQVEGATVRALLTPGHTVDHMCFVLEEENALFTGDNVLGHGYTVVEDLATYMDSLRTMSEQNCAIGYPAHGIKNENLPLKIREYIQHREIREKQILSALVRHKVSVVTKGHGGKGALTTRELVFFLHGDVPEDILEMALVPLLTEVLWKLAEDRKVGFEMDGGDRRWFICERGQALGSSIL